MPIWLLHVEILLLRMQQSKGGQVILRWAKRALEMMTDVDNPQQQHLRKTLLMCTKS